MIVKNLKELQAKVAGGTAAAQPAMNVMGNVAAVSQPTDFVTKINAYMGLANSLFANINALAKNIMNNPYVADKVGGLIGKTYSNQQAPKQNPVVQVKDEKGTLTAESIFKIIQESLGKIKTVLGDVTISKLQEEMKKNQNLITGMIKGAVEK